MKTTKRYTLALIFLLAASSMLWIESASAQSIPKPLVPEFTIKQVDRSYDVAPSASTNPYTGEPTTSPGYHVQKLSIEVTIKNQPFTPTTVNGNTTGLFYNIEAKADKPHYVSGADNYNQYAIGASSDNYTVVTVYLGNGEGGTWEISPGTQVEFRVQAVIGYSNFIWGSGLLPSGSDFTLLSAGDWSSTQTITIGEGNATPDPTGTQVPAETPTQAITEHSVAFGLSWEQIVIAVMVAAIIVLTVSIAVIWRKLRRK
jgi:hypothetical protein